MNPETILPCPNPECGMPCELKSLPGPTYRVQCTEKYCYIGPLGNTKEAALRKHNALCRRPADWSAAAREAADQITRECGGSAGWVQKIIEKYLIKHVQSQPSALSPVPSQEPVAENQECLEIAAKKLRRLRLTSVGGRKENPCATVKSALQNGLGGLYSDDAVLYILEAGIRYYNEAKSK